MYSKKIGNDNKSKKAILIILAILVICFGIKMLMNNIAKPDTDSSDAKTDVVADTVPGIVADSEIVITPIPTPTPAAEMEFDMDNQFYIREIDDEIFERIKGKSFKDDCTLDRSELRYLHVLHKNLEGESLEGELIVNKHISKDALKIFKELYEIDYPIEKIRLVDEYDADDESSMSDNNSSSFNFRFVARTTKISKHGYGLAIDINPLYNPYVTTVDGQQNVEPANADDYVDRERDFDYKIDHDDPAYQIFMKYGFEWGGDWNNSKDYQHFEIPSDKIKEWYPDY